MFSCIHCSNKYVVEDIKQGRYFLTTSTCLECYMKLLKSKLRCFGNKKLFDPNSIACGQECQDYRLCRFVIKHPDKL